MAKRTKRNLVLPASDPAYEADLARASRKAALAIMAQPLGLLGDEAGPSEDSGLAEEIQLDGERNRFDRLKLLALDGAAQEDLTWLCTEGRFISDRLQAAWWASMHNILMAHIAKSGLPFREFFDRDVQTLMQTGLFHVPLLMRMTARHESDWVALRRQDARQNYLKQRRLIAALAKDE